jgi:hypothetical protein
MDSAWLGRTIGTITASATIVAVTNVAVGVAEVAGFNA